VLIVALGRTQNLDKHEQSKLGVARLADRLRFLGDFDGKFYFDNVDVNGVLLNRRVCLNGPFLLSVLNAKLLDWRFKIGSVPFRMLERL